MGYDGTLSMLMEIGDKAGIDAFVTHSVATVPQQVETINDFIAQTAAQHPGRLYGFATMHPGFEPIDREIDRVISLGLKGVKIHPDFQQFHLDGKEAFRIYEAIEGRLPILIHTGDYRYEYSKATRMLSVMKRFPKLQAVCAHFGGWSEWVESTDILAGTGVMVDTSSSLYSITAEQAGKLIRQYGADNVLFGTDYPMWGPEHELKYMSRIELTDEEREKIMHGNAERLLGIKL
jgi:predicted TIM-barrel fold metal-dependent hydrolase